MHRTEKCLIVTVVFTSACLLHLQRNLSLFPLTMFFSFICRGKRNSHNCFLSLIILLCCKWCSAEKPSDLLSLILISSDIPNDLVFLSSSVQKQSKRKQSVSSTAPKNKAFKSRRYSPLDKITLPISWMPHY